MDPQSICAQYGADADKVVNELADFKVLYSLCTKPGSEDKVSDNKHNNGVDEPGEDTHITAESGELNYCHCKLTVHLTFVCTITHFPCVCSSNSIELYINIWLTLTPLTPLLTYLFNYMCI